MKTVRLTLHGAGVWVEEGQAAGYHVACRAGVGAGSMKPHCDVPTDTRDLMRGPDLMTPSTSNWSMHSSSMYHTAPLGVKTRMPPV